MQNQAQPHADLASMGPVEYRVLGPLTAVLGGSPRQLGGRRQRMVLAILLAHGNRVVSQDALIEAVWSGDPPEAARTTLHSYVSHLRRELGGEIERQGHGYVMAVDEASLDAIRFEHLVIDGRKKLEVDPARASTVLHEALVMWFGNPYGDLGGAPTLAAEVARLDDLRVVAVEERIAADLATGNHRGVVAELDTLAREYPYRERLHVLHMLALYRSGRQADALRAFQRTRTLLAEELGIDPSAELRDLEQRILEQDPGLEVSSVPQNGFVEVPGSKPEPGRSVSGYEFREQVGEGDYGVVYRAFQPSVGRVVAVKAIRPEYVNQPVFIRRFEAEANLVAQLEHPHIVPLFDFWRDPEGAFLVMPFLRGGNLMETLRRGPWNLAPALRLLDQVGSAIGYAHRQGVIHRDIKPGNVLLDEEGNAYLSDFGIAGRIIDDLGTPMTTSLAYVAPEETRGESLTIRSDLFSLGVLTFHLLTGVQPNGQEPLPSLVDARPGLPGELEAVLRKATDDQPANRYDKVEDFLRAVRRAVGADVVAIAEPSEPVPQGAPARNPYKGLRAFLETDALDFHGRDALTDELLRAVSVNPVVAVVGPSGCGKSSVVRAGLVPALRAGGLAGSRSWLITDMFPGSYPFEELEAALLRVAVERPPGLIDELAADDRGLLRVSKHILPNDESRLVLIIDQFEELFSSGTSEDTRRLFLRNLTTIAGDERSRVRVILTMRADFFDRPLEYPEFAAVLKAGLVTVSALSDEGLAQAIAGPARRVGLDLEPGLVGRITADVEGQPGGLPLLQYALTELFNRRQGSLLTIDGYQATGGVVGALGRRAEELYQELSPSGKEAVRQLFLRLVTVDEITGDTRRRVRQTELRTLAVDQGALDQALQQFGSFRLLSFDRHPVTRGPTVEVAHEALLREWDRLKEWIDGQREDLTLHRRLNSSAQEWVDSGLDRSFLLRGGRLDQAEQWAQGSGIALSYEEGEYLAASRKLRSAENLIVRKRRLMVTWGLVAAVVVLGVLVALALWQTQVARREARVAAAWDLAGESSLALDQDPELAILLGLAATEVSRQVGEAPLPEAVDALHQAIHGSRLEFRLEAYTNVEGSSDGSFFVTDSRTARGNQPQSDVVVREAVTGDQLRVMTGDSAVTEVLLSPDGRLVAVAYAPPMVGEGSPIVVWNPLTGEEVTRFMLPDHLTSVPMAWSPDSDRLAALSQGTTARATVWNVTTGVDIVSFAVPGASDIEFLDAEKLAVSNPQSERVDFYDSSNGDEVRQLDTDGFQASELAVGHSNQVLVLGSAATQQVQVRDLQTPSMPMWTSPLREPPVRQPIALQLSSDSLLLAASAPEGVVKIFDSANGRELMELSGTTGLVRDLAFVSNGDRLASVVSGGDTLVWDVSPGGPPSVATEVGLDAPCDLLLSSDGRRVAMTVAGTFAVVSLDAGQNIVTLPDQHISWFSLAAVSDDWRQVAMVDSSGDGWLRDLDTGSPISLLPPCTTPMGFSHDGSALVLDGRALCGLSPGRSMVIDPITGHELLDLGEREVWGPRAVFNPGGLVEADRYLAVNMEGVVELYDMASRELVAAVDLAVDSTISQAFDPTGRYLVGGTDFGDAWILDLSAIIEGLPVEDAIVNQFKVHSGAIRGVAINSNGLLATSGHGSLKVWDIHSGQLVAEPSVDIDTPPFSTFSADGEFLLYVDGGYVLRKYFFNLETLVDLAESRVTRELTEEECQRYLDPSRCG